MKSSDDFIGLCPICHTNDGFINTGRTHVGYCKEHKKSWLVGSNLFSNWRHETEEEQRRIWADVGMDDFENVEPYFEPVPTAAEKLAAEIVALREDIDTLRDRLDGVPPRSPEDMRVKRAERYEQVLVLVEAAVAGATKVIPEPQPNLAIVIAQQKGWDCHVAGKRRKEVPAEYRTVERAAEADAWLTGWDCYGDCYAEFQRDLGAA
jgi:hypothetical protein